MWFLPQKTSSSQVCLSPVPPCVAFWAPAVSSPLGRPLEEDQDEGGTSAHSHSTQELQALLGAGALTPEAALTVSAQRVSGPASVCSEQGVVAAPAPLLRCSAPGTSVYPPAHRPHHTWVVHVLASLTVSSAPVAGAGGAAHREQTGGRLSGCAQLIQPPCLACLACL